jgi:predicted ATPase with chaperone activity
VPVHPESAPRFRQSLSGPLLDRIDIHSEVLSVDFRDLTLADLAGHDAMTADHLLEDANNAFA